MWHFNLSGLDAASSPFTQNPTSSSAHVSSPPIPSLYRNKPTEGASIQTDSSTNKIPVFKFSDDVCMIIDYWNCKKNLNKKVI